MNWQDILKEDSLDKAVKEYKKLLLEKQAMLSLGMLTVNEMAKVQKLNDQLDELYDKILHMEEDAKRGESLDSDFGDEFSEDNA